MTSRSAQIIACVGLSFVLFLAILSPLAVLADTVAEENKLGDRSKTIVETSKGVEQEISPKDYRLLFYGALLGYIIHGLLGRALSFTIIGNW